MLSKMLFSEIGYEGSFKMEKKYTNYNFYFIQTFMGLKEVKKIHIYEGDKILFTMDKPWFKGVDSIEFKGVLEVKHNEDLELDKAHITTKNKSKNVELYIPNSITKFKLEKTENSEGFYKKTNIYKSQKEEFGFHVERVKFAENKEFIKSIQSACFGGPRPNGKSQDREEAS